MKPINPGQHVIQIKANWNKVRGRYSQAGTTCDTDKDKLKQGERQI